MSAVEVRGQIGPARPALLVLYTGGTFGMGQDADGSLVPLDLREPRPSAVPSSAAARADRGDVPRPDRLVSHGHIGLARHCRRDRRPCAGACRSGGAPRHRRMAHTASALSFLLEGIDIPIVLTGAQRPVTELRSDGRENLVTALAIAVGHLRGAALVPEVTIFFSDLLSAATEAISVLYLTRRLAGGRRLRRRLHRPAAARALRTTPRRAAAGHAAGQQGRHLLRPGRAGVTLTFADGTPSSTTSSSAPTASTRWCGARCGATPQARAQPAHLRRVHLRRHPRHRTGRCIVSHNRTTQGSWTAIRHKGRSGYSGGSSPPAP